MLADPAVRAASTAANSELLRLPGWHYAPFLEQYEAVVSAEVAFLDRHLHRERNRMTISKQNAPSFTWRDVCDGWTLLDAADLHLLQERMPPAASELLHIHARVRQVYFVLEGEATVDLDGVSESLRAGEALVIEPRTPHRISNHSGAEVEFLVISSSPPRHDRENLE